MARKLNAKLIPMLDSSQRSLLRAFGYEVPEPATEVCGDSGATLPEAISVSGDERSDETTADSKPDSSG
jgi:hypothetical protein